MVKINITEERGIEQSVGSDGLVSEATVRMRAGAVAASAPSHTCAWQSHAEIGTSNQDISAAEILTGLLVGDPTTDANWTLPAASLLVAAMPNAAIGDCIEVGVINTATSAQDEKITIVTSEAGITAVGLMVVDSQLVSGIRGSGSALFRIRITGIGSAAAYTIYRLT